MISDNVLNGTIDGLYFVIKDIIRDVSYSWKSDSISIHVLFDFCNTRQNFFVVSVHC